MGRELYEWKCVSNLKYYYSQLQIIVYYPFRGESGQSPIAHVLPIHYELQLTSSFWQVFEVFYVNLPQTTVFQSQRTSPRRGGEASDNLDGVSRLVGLAPPH